MADHDPLCPQHSDWDLGDTPCQCLWIRTGRADERERIAQEIQANEPGPCDAECTECVRCAVHLVRYRDARIARGPSPDPSPTTPTRVSTDVRDAPSIYDRTR